MCQKQSNLTNKMNEHIDKFQAYHEDKKERLRLLMIACKYAVSQNDIAAMHNEFAKFESEMTSYTQRVGSAFAQIKNDGKLISKEEQNLKSLNKELERKCESYDSQILMLEISRDDNSILDDSNVACASTQSISKKDGTDTDVTQNDTEDQTYSLDEALDAIASPYFMADSEEELLMDVGDDRLLSEDAVSATDSNNLKLVDILKDISEKLDVNTRLLSKQSGDIQQMMAKQDSLVKENLEMRKEMAEIISVMSAKSIEVMAKLESLPTKEVCQKAASAQLVEDKTVEASSSKIEKVKEAATTAPERQSYSAVLSRPANRDEFVTVERKRHRSPKSSTSASASDIVAKVAKLKDERNEKHLSHKKIVIPKGKVAEMTAKIAVVGDSNVKALLHDPSLAEWTLTDNVIVRCRRGGSAREELKKEMPLPENNKINTVILSFGGNDLGDYSYQAQKEKKIEKNAAKHLCQIVADDIVKLASNYAKTFKNVGVLLLPQRFGVEKHLVATVNEMCIEKFEKSNIKYVDVGKNMLDFEYAKKCLVNDGVHLRYDYFQHNLEMMCSNLKYDFILPENESEIDWARVLRNTCAHCGSKNHRICKKADFMKFEYTLCLRKGHVNKMCRSHYEKCNACGNYGHFSTTCNFKFQ